MGKVAKSSKKRVTTAASMRPWATGDFLIRPDGDLRRVGRCTKKGFELLARGDSGEWDHCYGTGEWSDTEKWYKLDKPVEEYQADLLKHLASGFDELEPASGSSTSTDVVLAGGKDQALAAKARAEQMNKQLAVLTGLMERQRRQLSNLRSYYRDQLEAINRVVDIIELYLGVYEQIVQIAEGEPASVDTPICFRQLVLHADEEVGDTGEDEIDFLNIEKFDAWVRKHYQQVLPEEKGVVIIRPRRHEKDYRLGDDLFARLAEQEMNEENFKTYTLIRNGKNLYRIQSKTIEIYPHLFPSQEEMTHLSDPESPRASFENKENRLLAYKRNVLMLQGLLDRTQVFSPKPEGLSLLNPNTYGSHVRFIYDATSVIGDGRPAFSDWLLALNNKLQRGDRVFFVGFPWGTFSDKDSRRSDLLERFPIPGWDSHRPQSGVYNIVRLESGQRLYGKAEFSCILHFNPKDKIWKNRTYWTGSHEKERKMSIPFRVYPDDEFVINYELVDSGDIDYYLRDRIHRHNYAKMMPVLRGIREQKAKEAEWEANFVRFVAGRTGHPEVAVREAASWWKTKVIDKRPLRKEDAKALRMIEAKLGRSGHRSKKTP